ncbi:hypothetical protein BH10PSE19_BH10PSE19_05830 [soil metagenome]
MSVLLTQKQIQQIKNSFQIYIESQIDSQARSKQPKALIPSSHLEQIKNYIISGKNLLPKYLKDIDSEAVPTDQHFSQQILYLRQCVLWRCLYQLLRRCDIPAGEKTEYVSFLRETQAALAENYRYLLNKQRREYGPKFQITLGGIVVLGVTGLICLQKGLYFGAGYCGLLITAGGFLLKSFASLIWLAKPPSPLAADLLLKTRQDSEPIMTIKPTTGIKVIPALGMGELVKKTTTGSVSLASSISAPSDRQQVRRQTTEYPHSLSRNTFHAQVRKQIRQAPLATFSEVAASSSTSSFSY